MAKAARQVRTSKDLVDTYLSVVRCLDSLEIVLKWLAKANDSQNDSEVGAKAFETLVDCVEKAEPLLEEQYEWDIELSWHCIAWDSCRDFCRDPSEVRQNCKS